MSDPVPVGTAAMAKVVLKMEGRLLAIKGMRSSELLAMFYSSVSLQQAVGPDASMAPRVKRIVVTLAQEVDRRLPIPSALVRG